MRTLDWYILRKFLLPFIYSFVGFVAIWFIIDLSDNLQDFIKGGAGWGPLLEYYRSQVPQIVTMSLPISCLLALLYCLTALSRSNEIISMLGAGISVVRLLMPLFAVGLILTGVTAYFNYEGAPHAEMQRKQMLKDIKRGHQKEIGLSSHLYRNREDYRIWFIRHLVASKNNMNDIQIIQQDAQGNILKEWLARSATYDPATGNWLLERVKYLEMTPVGELVKNELQDEVTLTGWKETPWRISSAVMNPNYLSVPELKDYLHYNSDFPETRLAAYRTQLEYRWALPWLCLLVVLIAAPLGVIYSRRGILGSVALAVVLFFTLIALSYLFIALGKATRLSPFTAAWGPPIAFFFIGLGLVWLRSTNRELPKFKLPWS